MHTFTTLLTAGALASVALAKPVPQVNTKKGYTVTGTIARPRPGAQSQYVNALRKYKGSVSAGLAAAAGGQGSVVANPQEQDVAYLCEVEIGGQKLNLDFDTGSADLWVFSSELSASVTNGHDIYNPSKSSSSKVVQGASWNITYGDGSGASGNVYTDDVTVGGITVKGQTVELAKQVSSQFSQDTDNDGLLGLAFSSINTVTPNPATTWFDTGRQQGLFDQNVFTVDLKHNAPGTYDFGFIDPSKHTGDIVYTSINNAQGFWEFTGTGYGVGNNFKQQSIDAIADTGTTLLLMDDAIVADYYSNVQGATNSQQQGGYVFDCSTTLPDFSLGIGAGKAVIPGSLMSLGAVSQGSSQCFGGIQSNSGIGLSIYGDIFLKAVLAVFDADNNQFGYAPKNTGAGSGNGGNGGSQTTTAAPTKTSSPAKTTTAKGGKTSTTAAAPTNGPSCDCDDWFCFDPQCFN